jgi:hypothetical protein
MVAIEDLSGQFDLKEIEKYEALKHSAELKLRSSLFSRMFGDEKKRIAAYDQELAALRAKVSFLKARSAPPRCLDCGSLEVAPLPTAPWPEEVGADVPAGWTHPLCGGEMIAKALPGRLHFSYPQRVYDEKGVSIAS